jgi:chromosome segregation ATPase
MTDKAVQNGSNKIPNAIQIDNKIKDAVTAQLSDLSNGLKPQQVDQKQVREHVREIMSNSKNFTTILDNYINRIKEMKEELPDAQWQEHITNRLAKMEQDNDAATKSLQLYEQGLQKVESKMRKTDMISTKAIDKASAVEERMTKMTKEIAEMRERIADLEHNNTHQDTEETTQQLQPIIKRITNIEQAIKEHPTKTQLKATIMKQLNKNAERMETIFNNNMTRLESQTDLAVSMTMYNALTSNKNNATLVEWTTTTNAPPH